MSRKLPTMAEVDYEKTLLANAKATEPKPVIAANRYRFDSEAHVHLLDGRPLIGTSRVGSVIAKPLAWYGSGKAVEVFGCPNPKVLTKIKNKKATKEETDAMRSALETSLWKLQHTSVDDFIAMIDKAYRAHDTYMRERAKGGTGTHAECEKFIKLRMLGGKIRFRDFDPAIHNFITWSDDHVKRYLWSEGHCYSEKHWLGGISDAGYEKMDGTFGILDFKSSKEAYVPQFWQCAGYDIQISENGVFDKDGKFIWAGIDHFDEYCIFAFGGGKPQPYFFHDPAGAQEAFLAALTIYKKLPQE